MIVSNSSPVIALSRIDRLDVFQSLFDEIYIPGSVYQETVVKATSNDQRDAILAAIQTGAIQVIEPSINHPFRRKLGAGERGALNLALEKNAIQVIMDDKKARNEARELGLSVAYTSDILKVAESDLLIVSYADVLKKLSSIGIYLPE